MHGDGKRPEDTGILIKKQNVRVFARLQAFLSPLFDAENPVSVTQPSYTQEFKSFYKYSPTKPSEETVKETEYG